jgi:hypothetical protein
MLSLIITSLSLCVCPETNSSGHSADSGDEEEEEDEGEDARVLTFWGSIFWLGCVLKC